MTLRELLTLVQRKRPASELSEAQLVEELNRFEDMVQAEVYALYENAPDEAEPYSVEAQDVTMQISSPWDDVYIYLALSKIDMDAGEVEDYNNDVAMLNAQMDSYRAHWARTHMPLQRYSIDPFGKRRATCVTPI